MKKESDEKAFMFSLTHKEKYEQVKNKDYAISRFFMSKWLLEIGKGNELAIYDNSD